MNDMNGSVAVEPAPIKPRKQRKKSLPVRKTGRIGNGHKSIPWQLREGPIAEARRAKWRAACEEKVWGPRRRGEVEGPRAGIPDGMRKAEAQAINEAARLSAEQTMKELIKQEVFVDPNLPGYTNDEAASQEAMTQALTIMRSAVHKDLKLKAALAILQFTKAKPEQKSKVTVESAEDWLKQCLAAPVEPPQADNTQSADISEPMDSDGPAGAN